MHSTPYKNKIIALATQHRKEQVIAPHFYKYLKAEIITPLINTDILGTFSGEVERVGSALEVAEKKARLGMQVTNLPYGLASEGSFGPHPFLPFMADNTEIILFVDDMLGFKVHEICLTEYTNYSYISVSNLKGAKVFLHGIKFPSHGLIIRPNEWKDKSILFKGIQSDAEFEYAFDISRRASPDKKVWLETDMRAHLNPTRMQVINQLAEKLVKRLSSLCPNCRIPGWGQIRSEKGLPCEYCFNPTEMIAYFVFGCVQCNYEELLPQQSDEKTAPAYYCHDCNP